MLVIVGQGGSIIEIKPFKLLTQFLSPSLQNGDGADLRILLQLVKVRRRFERNPHRNDVRIANLNATGPPNDYWDRTCRNDTQQTILLIDYY